MTSSNLRRVDLRWSGEGLVFVGKNPEGVEVTIDGDSSAGPSPMQTLLFGLAGCMAIDVKMILDKSRVPLRGMEIEVVGERAETEPKKFVGIELIYRLDGPGEEHEARLHRAIELSRDKYCSVLHSLDPGIHFEIRVERA